MDVVFSFTESQSAIYNEKSIMVYLQKTSDIQILYIPKIGRNAIGNVTLKAVSTINQVDFEIEAAEEGDSLLYHKMMVELRENLPAGEYEYTFSDEVGELSSGILVIGELAYPVEYIAESEYEQYEN